MTIQRRRRRQPHPAQQAGPDHGSSSTRSRVTDDVGEDWRQLRQRKRRDAELDALIAEEALKAGRDAGPSSPTPSATAPSRRPGTAITRDPAAGLTVLAGQRPRAKKQRVLGKLVEFFDRYFGLI